MSAVNVCQTLRFCLLSSPLSQRQLKGMLVSFFLAWLVCIPLASSATKVSSLKNRVVTALALLGACSDRALSCDSMLSELGQTANGQPRILTSLLYHVYTFYLSHGVFTQHVNTDALSVRAQQCMGNLPLSVDLLREAFSNYIGFVNFVSLASLWLSVMVLWGWPTPAGWRQDRLPPLLRL